MEDVICIRNAYNSEEAEMIASRLNSAGIQCYLKSDNAGGMLSYLTASSGVDVMVRAEDAEYASELLSNPVYYEDIEEEDLFFTEEEIED